MVVNWGTGRKDYSSNVEMSVVPTARSYQVNAYASSTFTIAASSTSSITPTMDFSTGASNHFVFNIDVTVDANVLIGADIYSGGLLHLSRQGYQNININIPQGLPTSDLSLIVTNFSDRIISGAYSHNGIQGTEKIMPIPTP